MIAAGLFGLFDDGNWYLVSVGGHKGHGWAIAPHGWTLTDHPRHTLLCADWHGPRAVALAIAILDNRAKQRGRKPTEAAFLRNEQKPEIAAAGVQ